MDEQNPRLQLDFLEMQLARLDPGKQTDARRFDRTKHLFKRHAKQGLLLTDRTKLENLILETKRAIVKRKVHFTESVLARSIKNFKKVEPLRINKRQKSGNSASAVSEQELAFINELDVHATSADIVLRGIAKKFSLDAVFGEFPAKKALSVPESNVYARLCKTKAVRDALAGLFETVAEFFPEDKPHLTNESETKTKDKAKDEADEVKDKTTKQEKRTNKNEETNTNTNEEASEATFIALSEPEAEEDDFFEEHVSADLPVLNEGFISGSDDSDDGIEPINTRARRNRRGQRARRKIWEQKFGSRANHVLKEQQQKAEAEADKKAKKQKKALKMAEIQKQRAAFASRPLHPSWEAQIARKRHAATATHGKKTKF